VIAALARPVHELPDKNRSLLGHQPKRAIEATQDHDGVAAFWPPVEFQDPRFLLVEELADISYAPVSAGKTSVVRILEHGAPSAAEGRR
jgi:hypothetical protein